ncbi:cyclin-dependent kinase-like 4 isoform X2 [Venturia canescens]|nr:cyclin-dependent kinase-like 4 isoform X2 [Venturia canescens]XP_043280716.1 cyclin-dependent kinase-like 4 isoform X2 [Venturia canescens]
MDKYETVEVVGEGSYGIVMKCRHRESGQTVAIKKFLETEEDVHVRKMALREIRMLKKLRHDNLVNLIEVFRRRKRFYLVFEYLDHTVLDELEEKAGGLGLQISRRHIFQVLRGLSFCHANHIMHRDVKPENVLVSPNGVIKLCDFGFARFVTGPNESCTDYVATRWYRAPELLVGDRRYGRPVDVWAVGCLYAEMVTGEPLFPGDSDLDQLYQITRLLGSLCSRHQTMISRGDNKRISRRSSTDEFSSPSPATLSRSLRSLFPTWTFASIDFLAQCLRMDPETRPSCVNLLQHSLFCQDSFAERFLQELQHNIAKEACHNQLFLKRTESRRFQNFANALDESKKFYGSAGRWRMHLINESTNAKSNRMTKNSTNGSAESIQEASHLGRISSSMMSTISINREPFSIGSISVIPNTTYIRPLDKNRGLGISASINNKTDCSLPALTLRDKGMKRALKERGMPS